MFCHYIDLKWNYKTYFFSKLPDASFGFKHDGPKMTSVDQSTEGNELKQMKCEPAMLI